MFYVVSYDIVDDRKRTRVADILKDYGTRVQYSVFECNLDKDLIRRMTKELLKHINCEEDSLRIYRLCEDCITKVGTYGVCNRLRYKDEDVVVI